MHDFPPELIEHVSWLMAGEACTAGAALAGAPTAGAGAFVVGAACFTAAEYAGQQWPVDARWNRGLIIFLVTVAVIIAMIIYGRSTRKRNR